jgi:hypothetical protein
MQTSRGAFSLEQKNLRVSLESYCLIPFLVERNNLIFDIGNNTCLLAADGWGDAPHPVDLIMGIPLLQTYCTIFDVGNDRVGFAKRINQT